MAGEGLVSMTPTSIAHSGTSATINADGGVDFSAVTSLSLNGVFTSDYDNYLIVLTISNDDTDQNVLLNLRASGSDATASDYARQRLSVSGSSATSARLTSQTVATVASSTTNGAGDHIHVYGPALAEPTVFRNVSIGSAGNANMTDNACIHSLSTSYDGFTITTSTGNNTGTIHVFGYEE